MYKSVLRAAPRYALPLCNLPRNSSARRLLSTAQAGQKRRGWTNSAVRWGLAVGAVYAYSTSNVFAEEPEAAIRRIDDSIHAVQESNQPTIDAIVEEKRRREAQQAAVEREKQRQARAVSADTEEAQSEDAEDAEDGIGGLADEADSQGAFNPETGEINWDCPCLGGMAHGPCGEEFRAAFSCFVYSEEEPKGIECIEKFKGMQDCFRQHPEMYGSELEDDEDAVEEELMARESDSSSETEGASSASAAESTSPVEQKTAQPREPNLTDSKADPGDRHADNEAKKTSRAQPEGNSNTQASIDEQANNDKDDELIPRAAHDATK